MQLLGRVEGEIVSQKRTFRAMPRSDKPSCLSPINRAAGTGLSEWFLCYHLVLTTLNQRVQGSSPCAPTIFGNNFIYVHVETKSAYGIRSGVVPRRPRDS